MEGAEEIQKEAEFERIKLFYRDGAFGLLGVLVGGIALVYFMQDSVPRQALAAWFLVLLAINVPRFLIIHFFHRGLRRSTIVQENAGNWKKLYYYGYIISSVAWLYVAYLPFEKNEILNLMFIGFVMSALVSGAVTIYSTSFFLMVTYVSMMMLPLSARFLLLEDEIARIVGVFCLIYFIFMLRVIKRSNKSILDNITLKIQSHRISMRDPLTGLYNRRRLHLFLENFIPRSERKAHPFFILLLDIDDFKSYNDALGHLKGDALLRDLASVIMENIRGGDLAVRFGGEEFLIVMPDAGAREARKAAERILRKTREALGVTLSGGLAGYRRGVSFGEILAGADRALYRAKREGKDRIVLGASVEPGESAGNRV